jgi:hypothetical protein
MRWRAAIRGCFFIHTAVARLFDKTGIKGEHRVLIRQNTGNFTKRVPVTGLAGELLFLANKTPVF